MIEGTKSGKTVVREPAKWKCTWTYRKSRLTREYARKMRAPRQGQPLCASLCNRNSHGHLTKMSRPRQSKCATRRAILGKNLRQTCHAPRSGRNVCTSLPSQNALGHLRRAIYARIYRENTGDQMDYPDLTPPLTPTVRTPECKHMVWGEIHQH